MKEILPYAKILRVSMLCFDYSLNIHKDNSNLPLSGRLLGTLPPFELDWIINYVCASMSLTLLLYPNKCNVDFCKGLTCSFSSHTHMKRIFIQCKSHSKVVHGWWKNVQNGAHTLWFVQLKQNEKESHVVLNIVSKAQ